MPTTIDAILDQLRSAAWDSRDKGDRFERLMVGFFKTDPLYADRFDEVWQWSHWPDRPPHSDAGIDIVARERDGSGLCAVQCKFYEPHEYLPKEGINSFLAESGREGFVSRIIVSTTDNWSKQAEQTLEGQSVPVARIGVADLGESAVDWSQFSIERPELLVRRPQKTIRPHQALALEKVREGFEASDRGKLIMACGTGKTMTSLRIAEDLVKPGGSVLFFVPSISLLGQALKEWSSNAIMPLRVYGVCSDVRAGKRTESEDIGPYDLAVPPTTNPHKLVAQIGRPDHEAVTVVFSTYQSIETIHQAQRQGASPFDLVICDEAHRTTGRTLSGDEESAFVRVHDNSYLAAAKRLYMTATPRIYTDSAQSRAKEADAVLVSMDDEAIYGPEFYRLSFGNAVDQGLLSDYKVLVLAVNEQEVSATFQAQIADENSEIRLEDAAKIVGCWNGLSKRGVHEEDFSLDPAPMKRAVAFSTSIKASKSFTSSFTEIVRDALVTERTQGRLDCDIEHVDGNFNALRRAEKLDWLRADIPDGHCRILSNARCLSEGVDVPSLDAVLFLNPRKSQVDVVQAVGRVMRKAPGKEYGYVILPIAVPSDMPPHEALRENENYRIVWQVLQALRAHDERFNALINKIDLNGSAEGKIGLIGASAYEPGDHEEASRPSASRMFTPTYLADLRSALFARIVEKVGDKLYWEDWAHDVAEIAGRHTARIKALLQGDDPILREVFSSFLAGLRAILNDGITEDQAIEMLSQHSVTKPVFDALFEGYSFADHNPVSLVMQEILDVLDKSRVADESESLEPFYESVRWRASGITSPEGRQRIIVELYEKFFKLAFPKMADQLGIVYTPVEIVDFILNSVEHALRAHFGASVSDNKVHLLDPFTGTGTFITRLIQSGLIRPDDMPRKFQIELHANEIVLLAYYVAAINIEATYHDLRGGQYEPFEGIVLTDTFQSSEFGDVVDTSVFTGNNERLDKQKREDITVIVANPPYSAGQTSENDNNQNLRYPTLDGRIRETYAAQSTATLKNGLYDSYVRAFRWASDRIGDRGVIGFVSNGAFIDAGAFDGFRAALQSEFSAIYCFNLRGNQRTSGETSRREGGKVFGGGSRTPVAITLLVKDPAHAGAATIHYRDIGDYLSREEKLAIIAEYRDVGALPWEHVTPNGQHDWINLRDEAFASFAPLGNNRDSSAGAIFDLYSGGLKTNRDAWAYNSSRDHLLHNMRRMIETYLGQLEGYGEWVAAKKVARTDETVNEFIDNDPSHISWTRALKADLRKAKTADFRPSAAVKSMYRPFFKQWLYFDRQFNEMVLQIPRILPTAAHKNKLIVTSGVGLGAGYSVLMTDVIPDQTLPGAGNSTQCFPLYRYDPIDKGRLAMDSDAVDGYIRRDAITDETLSTYQRHYQTTLTKEDIFYYIYGLLHSPIYRERYAADLGKMIPRIPMAPEFLGFSRAGRDFARWHLGYESVDIWPLDGLPNPGTAASELRVEKMRFAGSGRTKDKSRIVFNRHIALSGIPDDAYRYEVNGKTAIEWLMDRYEVKSDPASGILNDPNLYSDDPRYIVELVARIVRVSIETMKIVDALPPIE